MTIDDNEVAGKIIIMRNDMKLRTERIEEEIKMLSNFICDDEWHLAARQIKIISIECNKQWEISSDLKYEEDLLET